MTCKIKNHLELYSTIMVINMTNQSLSKLSLVLLWVTIVR